jgi:hypothetical protein
MKTTTTLTARSPEDLMAVVPAVLGFHPEDSLVMLTFGGGGGFHARIDLPTEPGQVPEACFALLQPALRQKVQKVIFIAYSADAERATAVALAASDVFELEGFDVMEPLRSDGSSWHFVCSCDDPDHVGPHPYDVSAHPFTAEAVLEGRVTHATRDELARTLRPDGEATCRIEAALAAPPPRRDRAREQRRMEKLVRRHIRERTEPSDADVVWLALACTDVLVRDVALFLADRESARDHADFWRSVLRRTPERWLPGPAAMLGFCAWLAGDGALAWCAVDRCREVDPDYSLADCVAELLTRAVPPRTWGTQTWGR